ncbi:phage holin [Cytobacillus gottheilii]|uniref:phage holin n=1 Tax=Cytobacillus gottheilii TaxID=859144 RepID=UPI0009BA88CB|nr:phage holin [Cytobacillus gottheilii]
MDKMVLIRTIVLAVALLNQVLVMSGLSPLPFDDAQVEQGVSALFTVVASIWSWWKNNSFSRNAQKADEVLKELNNK